MLPRGYHIYGRWALAGTGTSSAMSYLLLMLAWLSLWRLSALMEYTPHASLWFPPAGLTFAALLMLGSRALLPLMLCAIGVTFWIDHIYRMQAPWRELLTAGVLFAVAHCGPYALGAWLLKRLIGTRVMASAPAVIPLFLMLGCLSALGAALLGAGALECAGVIGSAEFGDIWLPWWIGDMAGVIVLTPLFLGILSWHYPRIEPWFGGMSFAMLHGPLRGFALKLAICLSLLSLIMLASAQAQAYARANEVAYAIFFLIIPQMWIVYTESALRSALSLALFSTVTAVWVALLGLVEQSLTYQFAICVIAASGYFGFAVPALVAHNRQLSELAFHDGLTGALTKGYFFDCAEQRLAEARRRGRAVSLVLIDMDRFKWINDTHGHDVGDEALARLCDGLRERLGSDDLLGRFGGDEFTLLLVDTDVDADVSGVEALRSRLADTCVPGTEERLSATFGAVTLKEDESIMAAFKRADVKLLEAKRQRCHPGGRDDLG